jgi:hypothetical protein
MFPTYHLHDFQSAHALFGQVVVECFEQLLHPATLHWPHRRSFYEILWLIEGTATQSRGLKHTFVWLNCLCSCVVEYE